MRRSNRKQLFVESLNERITPATFATSVIGGTLVVNQVDAAIGAIVITDNAAAGSVTVDDLADVHAPLVIATGATSNLIVNLKAADATPVLYDITSARAGNTTLNLKNAVPRALILDGGFTIGGNFTVVGGNGGLMVIESGMPLLVGGNATFKGGSGLDLLNLSIVGGTSIGGNLALSKFNSVGTNAGDSIGGWLGFNAAGEANPNFLLLTDTEIGGNLNYVGGTQADMIFLGGTVTEVNGNVNVKFGGQLPADASIFAQAPGPTSIIGGNVKVVGGNIGTETVMLSGVVGGNVRFNLGSGSNNAAVNGTFLGSKFNYTGGAGVDNVMYSPLIGSASDFADSPPRRRI